MIEITNTLKPNKTTFKDLKEGDFFVWSSIGKAYEAGKLAIRCKTKDIGGYNCILMSIQYAGPVYDRMSDDYTVVKVDDVTISIKY